MNKAIPDFEVVHGNLREAMRFFGNATGKGEVRALNGAVAIYAGMDYGVFNISMLDAMADAQAPGGIGFEQRLAACASYFARRSSRWSFWLCEDALESRDRRQAAEFLADRGLQQIAEAPGMMTPALKPPARNLPAIDCFAVSDQTSREAFAGVVALSFDIPMQIAQAVYHPEGAWRGAYQGFVGSVNGEPIAVVALVVTGNAVGIYSLATMPEYRGRGYGEALLRAALAERQKSINIEKLVLQSTEAGYSLYKRLGFQNVARFSVYLTK